MSELTNNHKRIYNHYLKAYRINNNQPFRPKKKFDDVEKNVEIKQYLNKLDGVFKQYPAFFTDEFFNAPYEIYTDAPEGKKYYSLKFYSSHKGISTCIAYYKLLLQSSPEEQFEHFKSSFKFIAEFCIEKNIDFRDYTSYCSVSQRDCLKHLKEHKISWYVVFAIPSFYELLYNMPEDEFALYYGQNVDLSELYGRFMGSKKTQDYMSEIKKRIIPFIRNSLKK